MTLPRIALLTALVFAGCHTVPDTPDMEIADRLVWSEKPTLTASGLEAGSSYTLMTERKSFWNADATERSQLTYVADDRGRIDTSLQTPEGADAASPYLPIRNMAYLQDETLEDLEPDMLRFRLLDAEGLLVLERVVGIGPDRTDLIEAPLSDEFPGAYIIKRRDQSGPQPAIVVLGGSEGGDGGSRYVAPILAAEGYTVLGLPYYSPAWFGQTAQFPDLPRAFAELPVDYLEAAVAALRQRPDVDGNRISLQGGSKGAEFVLLAGSLIPDKSPGGGYCGIVADVPTDVVWEGWGPGTKTGETSGFSWRGEALPFVPYKDMSRALDRSDPYTMTQAHENGRAENPESLERARIRVENIDESVMLIGGDADTTWASGAMSRLIAKTRGTYDLPTETYVYTEAGHGVGGSPLVRTTAANLNARLENFPAMMAFHARNSKRDDCRQ